MAVAREKPLEIDIVTQDDNLILVKVKGHVIDDNLKHLQDKLEQVYGSNVPRIILDVSGISFLTSHGLGAIVYMHSLMKKSGRQLLLFNSKHNPSVYLDELFEKTHLDQVLNIIR